MDHTDTADFAKGLVPVNAIAESSPGFVWRLQDDSGDATSITAFDNPLAIVNLTVWESVADLREFAFKGTHVEFFKRRSEWFLPTESRSALWWIPAGSLPTVDDALRRLSFIDRFGDSPYAFQFGQKHPTIVFHHTGAPHPDAEMLIGRLNHELDEMHADPGADRFRLDEHEVQPGTAAFVVAYIDGVPMAVGAHRSLDDSTAEITHMYVADAASGLKVGVALLAELEGRAGADGVHALHVPG